ncbi:MAG: manganese efflux pump MntP family protein [Lachnospiraceae bacterium]|nr:manganese efflux pump MntP family protein [Lachnospiraceae bacterium]
MFRSLLINSFFLGIGLAMDAFSVSVANGLSFPKMKSGEKFRIAFVFAFFQFLMPVIGWGFVTRLEALFSKISRFIPWIAFAMLLFIGGKMILEAVRELTGKKSGTGDYGKDDKKRENEESRKKEDYAEDGRKNKSGAEGKILTGTLIMQGMATSLDALSAGFTISEYSLAYALLCAGIIAVVTFVLCLAGVILGKKIGERISTIATIFGGCILILIGIKILLGL